MVYGKKTIINVVFLYTGSKPKTYFNIILIHTLELDHVDSNYCSILTFYKKLFYNKTFFILYFFLLSIRRKKYPISLIRSMIDPSLKREFSLVYDSLCSDWLVKKKRRVLDRYIQSFIVCKAPRKTVPYFFRDSKIYG